MRPKLILILLFFSFVFLIIFYRMVQLALFPEDILLSYKSIPRIRSLRGKIMGRDSTPLALSFKKYNIYFNPRQEYSPGGLSNACNILNLDQKKVAGAIAKNKTFPLKIFTSASNKKKIASLREPAFLSERIFQRFYPEDDLLAQVTGFTGYYGKGLTGLEKYYNSFLAVTNYNDKKIPALYLTIATKLQDYIEEQLDKAVKEHNAQSGIVIIQEADTGRILVMANSPRFNLNNFKKVSAKLYKNISVCRHLEPGSIFKLFFLAYLIDKYHIDISDKYYNCQGALSLPNEKKEITCGHKHGLVNFQKIIKYSCNVGMVKATAGLTRKEMYNFLTTFHFGKKTGISIPGENKGILPALKEWGIRTKATIPIGQGLAVTPVQLISAFSSLINGGIYYKPSLILKKIKYNKNGRLQTNIIKPVAVNRTIKRETSAKAVKLLSYGTIRGSTGFRARRDDYQAGGKTGTSQIADLKRGGYYSNKYHAGFIGIYPKKNPVITVLIIISEPEYGKFGGKVAAPLFAAIIPEISRSLKITTGQRTEKYANEVLKVHNIKKNSGELLPDLRGLSLRDALIRFQNFNNKHDRQYKLKIKGKGYVKQQDPPPHTRNISGNTIILRLELE